MTDNNIFTNPEGKFKDYMQTHAYKDSMLEVLGECLEEVIIDCEKLEELYKKARSENEYQAQTLQLALDSVGETNYQMGELDKKYQKVISERDDMQKCAKVLFEELQAVVYAPEYDVHYLELLLEEYRGKV